MYKQYSKAAEPDPTSPFGGGEADSWTRLWRNLALPTDSQVRYLEKSLEWREMARHCRPGWRVLEAGCGLGGWVRFLASQGLNPTGVDYSREVIERLDREFPDLDWRCDNIEAMEFGDGAFDAAVCWGVIEHFEQGAQAAVEELLRVIKPGGLLFITVPWLNPHRRKATMPDGGDNRRDFPDGRAVFHQYLMTEDEFRSIIEGAGFEIVNIQGTSRTARNILPQSFRTRMPFLTRAFNKVFSPILPAKMVAHMIMIVGRKPE